MTKALGCGIAIVGLLVLVGFMGVGQYNGLVGSEQAVSAAWAQVENTYQRRADLIPNLVATVKGSAAFEQETLQAVVEARSRVGQISGQATQEILSNPEKFAQFQQAQDGLSSALSRLMVVVETVPGVEVDGRLQRPDDAARRDREPDHRRAHALQRGGPGVQHAARQVPDQPLRPDPRLALHRAAVLRRPAGAATAPKVEF